MGKLHDYLMGVVTDMLLMLVILLWAVGDARGAEPAAYVSGPSITLLCHDARYPTSLYTIVVDARSHERGMFCVVDPETNGRQPPPVPRRKPEEGKR